MTGSSSPLGVVIGLQLRREAVLARSSAAVVARIKGTRPSWSVEDQAVPSVEKLPDPPRAEGQRIQMDRPLYANSRYTPPRLANIIALVSREAAIPVPVICGFSRHADVVHARSAIAALTEEFAGDYNDCSVDDAMLRTPGMVAYYRDRHSDRVVLWPEYAGLHERCRTIMVGKHRR